MHHASACCHSSYRILMLVISFLFFFSDTATTEIYTLSLHDALPIYTEEHVGFEVAGGVLNVVAQITGGHDEGDRSEEHTSELQSRQYLVCRLLLEKKKRRGSADRVFQAASCPRRRPLRPGRLSVRRC